MASYVNGTHNDRQEYQSTATGAQYNENDNSASKPAAQETTKEEVGWYFVERYYTTLSDKPDQLHLFYNKKSQFVCGKENAIQPIIIGRSGIQEQIRQLSFQGSKVRVSNVDTQSAFGESIVIQVIGEIFNGVLRKFAQTFILARQAQGWYVLNDILRYLNDEEEPEAPAAEEVAPVAAEESAVEEIPKAEEPVEAPKELDVVEVDKELESVLASEPATQAPVTNGNGVALEPDKAEDEPVAAKEPEASVTPEVAEKQVEEELAKQEEKPKAPAATPAIIAQPPQAKPVSPVQPAAPAKAMTWASRAAAAIPAKPAPVLPGKAATPPVQPRAAPPPATPTANAAPASIASAPSEKESSTGWQTAGSEQKRPRPQSIVGLAPKEPETLGYVRNVTEKVKADELRATLSKYGELIYFDINQGKNCAFVEFKDAAGYRAAVQANPHVVSGENIVIEPRRPKAAAYGGAGYNNSRGGLNNRGRGNFDQGRSGSQGGGRGGFAPRGRGPQNGASRSSGQRPTGQTTLV